jgi:hypothetical protein
VDTAPEIKHAIALAPGPGTWVRDEEAASTRRICPQLCIKAVLLRGNARRLHRERETPGLGIYAGDTPGEIPHTAHHLPAFEPVTA